MEWEIYDEQDERIQNVIADIEDDEMKLYEAWSKYLAEKLKFPFEAEVNEYQEPKCFIQQGDKLKVIKIESEEDLYGIIVEVRFESKQRYFPLCDLKALDLDDDGKEALYDYRVWFANR